MMGSHDDKKRARLVEALASNLEPVRPVSLARHFVACLGLGAVVVAAAASLLGVREDLAERLSEPVFLAVVGVLALSSAWCASVAVRLSVPGRYVSRPASWLLLATPMLLAVFVVVARPWGGTWPGWGPLLTGCVQCMGVTAISAAAPWLVVLVTVGRLAPLDVLRVGMFTGFSAFLLGALVTELACMNGSGYHLALGHYLPVVLLSALSSVIAAAALRARLRPAVPELDGDG
jgi:hypothetical protein